MKIFILNLVIFLKLFLASGTPSVIIVGAGPAGIAAASKLLENGYRKVLILEAENRIGGRVNSVMFGEAFIDMGAEWCHGEKDNVVYELVKDLKVFGHTVSPTVIYHSSRKYLDASFSEELIEIMESIYEPDGHKGQEEGLTLGSYCIERFNRSIHRKFHKNPEKLELAKSSLDLFHHVVLGSEGAFSWFEPSAESDYRDCEGDLNLNWNGLGYKTALEVLMKRLPDPTKQLPFDQIVLLNKEVTKVLWNESAIRNSVTVECSDKTAYVADHVIFTPSIGVLKERHEGMFCPRLPKSKQEAIQQIGFGAVMKVAMHFKKIWWGGRNFTGFNFIWDREDVKMVLKEFPKGPLKDGRLWVTYLFSVIPVEHNPNVLIGWLTGDLIPEIESLSNETIVHGIVFAMNKFLGHLYNITEPDAIIRSHWWTNPHFRGSYSYQTIEARRCDVTAEVELAKPLVNVEGRPILQFAGEASHPYYYSTVHGAVETGYREANRIMFRH